jgi:hypothetical protein
MRRPVVAEILATHPPRKAGEVNSTAVPTGPRAARPRKVKALLAALACTGVLALTLAPAAMAQSSSVDTYAGQGGNVAAQVDPGGSASASDPGGSLPFTGFDVALAAAGALVLLLAGGALALRVPSTKGKPS